MPESVRDMKINVCINGTFRYPQYIRYYDSNDALKRFYFSHRITTGAEQLGLRPSSACNVWLKEYLLHAALGYAKIFNEQTVYTAVCDLWQSAVIRRWVDCDSVEAVIGEVADKVILHARSRGSRILGHPVNSHPHTFAEIVNEENARLGTGLAPIKVSRRRLAEIDLCDALIADSQFVRNSYIANGLPSDRIFVIPPGNDTVRFSPRRADEIDRAVFRVVCVGQISARKGQRYLLEAWRSLRLKNSELVLVGSRARSSAAVVKGFEDAFVHYEHLPNARLRNLLATASAFVLPSVEDGFGQAAMEALSCGVPTIVTDNTGVADVIQDGVNGFVVRAQRADLIAARLLDLYSSQTLVEKIGASAAAYAASNFSWESYVLQVLKVHAKILN